MLFQKMLLILFFCDVKNAKYDKHKSITTYDKCYYINQFPFKTYNLHVKKISHSFNDLQCHITNYTP